MSPAERALWSRIQRRAALLTPELAAAFFLAYAVLREQLSEDDLARAIQAGLAEQLLTNVLTDAIRMAAYQPIRERLRQGLVQGVKYYGRDIPLPPSSRSLTIGFDVLNPRTIDAVRTLETRVITNLETSIAETLAAYTENGLRDGQHPRAIARALRRDRIIGLAPNQEQWVENYARAVAEAHQRADALGYELRDRRFDAAVVKARKTGTPIPPETAAKMVDGMRRKTLAFQTETVSRTASLDAQKLAQRLSWEDAIAKGIIGRDEIERIWVGVMDQRERPTHVQMEGQTVGFDERFSNGQLQPGEDEYNCRCIVRYRRRRAA